ncbi:skin secretory protein xP2-like [Delphinus delphis]|uniref:skin secretory protein xP2-like n=1 Tax=Delphinus delphis TaxID=9728 RepID=UPI0028C48CB2|nr:collagen alpha-1(III) chain-like [Delphinus delphis]
MGKRGAHVRVHGQGRAKPAQPQAPPSAPGSGGGVRGCPESRTAPFASPGRRGRSNARVQPGEGGTRGARLAKPVPAARGEDGRGEAAPAPPERQARLPYRLDPTRELLTAAGTREDEGTAQPRAPEGRPCRGTAWSGHAPAPTGARRRRRARPAPPTTAGRAACEALEEELRSESACCSEDPGPFHAVRQGRETESPAGCHTPPSTADRTKSGPVGHERPFLVRPGRAGHHHMDRWADQDHF